MAKVLVVDDNKDIQFGISNILREEGFETIAVGDGRRAIKEVKERPPNLVLLDIKLPGMDGMKILEEMKTIDERLSIIMLTAYGDIKDAVRAMKLGAFDYVTKPFDNEELVLTIKKALETQDLSREVEVLRKRLGERAPMEEVMGMSPAIKKVLRQVEIIAPANMTVILQGASGTGKELIAQIVHYKSRRRDKPFVAVDSGAIPETLVESELFGYERGAFTGAEERREGKFEQANGGTLLLDEVTNLSDAMQMKLLRVLQERKLQHLGGRKDISIDVRIIVATNTNLSELVRSGKFRDDLFHRLNEFQIELPLLRERKEDIPVLAATFLKEANLELNKKVKGFSAEAMRFLLTYVWPGNVRELKNMVKRAVLLADSDYISQDDLSTNGDTSLLGCVPILSGEENLRLDSSASYKVTTQEFEKKLIQQALEKSAGNKIKAAGFLKMNRKMLYRKMKNFGL